MPDPDPLAPPSQRIGPPAAPAITAPARPARIVTAPQPAPPPELSPTVHHFSLRPRRSVAAITALLAVAVLALAACSSDDEPEPNAISISGGDFSFEVADGSLSPGTNTIAFENDGEQVHHLQLVQLLDGKTLEDTGPALAASQTAGFPSWMRFAGGVGQVAPGGSGSVTADIAEGSYALLCFIPDTDGVPHFAKGMIAALSTEGDANEAPLPDASITIDAVDYAFEAPASIEVGADTVIELTNSGSEPHEVNLVQLAPGATVADFLAGLSPDSTEPPPGLPIGGIQAILPGDSQRATVNLAAGSYALICYIPDAGGTPHFALGMATALEVTD